MAYKAGTIVIASEELNLVMDRGLRDVDRTPRDNRTRIQRNSMTDTSDGGSGGGEVGYRGPFMAQKIDNFIRIASPAEFMGGNTGYAGSICAPDMQILKHVESIDVSFTEGQENTLFCLAVTWLEDGLIDVNSGFYPDPWKTCSDTDRLITADAVNPKTEENPARDPFLSIYPIFRMEGSKIVQIQQGHIVEYNRWWRS